MVMPAFFFTSTQSRALGRRLLLLAQWALLFFLADVRPARADEPAKEAEEEEGKTSLGLGPAMGLDPAAPQTAALPGGMTPAFGQKPLSDAEWRFDFHGFLRAPLTAGINSRPSPRAGQSDSVLHSPPVVPDDFETFSHTSVVPTTYAQLNLSNGNRYVTGNVTILARQANVSESFIEPVSQLGINDIFVSIRPDFGPRVRTQVLVGAFTSRYGGAGEYDEGRYGTPLIVRINGIGEQIATRAAFGNYTIFIEQGLQGQTNKAASSITPDLWNGFADPAEGTTFVNHLHAGFAYRSFATLGTHFISASSRDDRATGTLLPDGNITVLATDLRMTMGRFGHLYFAFARTKATHARTVSRIVSVLNTPGGNGLMNNYLGPGSEGGDGTGSLSTFGGQYDLSVGRLLSYPVAFTPGPDIVVSVFALATRVESEVARFDNVTKWKYGAEATYGVLPWLAVSARYDRVLPQRGTGPVPSTTNPLVDDERYNFAVLSPRLIFRTGWNSTDQVVLQYSRWLNGDLTSVRTGAPPLEDYRVVPDKDMISLSASMWW